MLGCSSYRGTAYDASSASIAQEPGWILLEGVPDIRQEGLKDCGAAALAAVLGYWGSKTTPSQIEASVDASRGIAAADLERYAKNQGLMAFVFYGDFLNLEYELRRGRPAIVGLAKPIDERSALLHYEVLVGFHPRQRKVLTLDPARGLRENSLAGFLAEWRPTGRLTVVVFAPPSQQRLGRFRKPGVPKGLLSELEP